MKSLPYSKESEMMVLGCMLTHINSLNVAADALDEQDFFFSEHKLIFLVLKGAYKQDKAADLHIVCEELKRRNQLDGVGGASYIATLAQYAGTSAFIEEYVALVKDKSILRKMVQAAQQVEKNSLEEPQDVQTALDEAQQLFFKISQASNPGAGIHIRDILTGVKSSSQLPYIKELQERQEKYHTLGPDEAKITGTPSHFIDLDKIINGLNQSHLLILAARPAMGKTAFALNVAENVCFKSGKSVGIFSLEMTAEQLLHRIICSQAGVESDKIRTGSLSGADFQRIVSTIGKMQQHTMVIDDQPGLKITDLRARARRMKESYDIQLLIIDYLQLLSGSGGPRNMDNRQNEISEISRMLKTLSRELNIPILCLSQLSRKVEDRAGHRPMMSDLRESGCLVGDTLVRDALFGTYHTLESLAQRKKQTPMMVYALDSSNQLGKYAMTRVFYSGKKGIFELTTSAGRKISGTGNHPFMTKEGWKALELLKVGEWLAMAPVHTSEVPVAAPQKVDLLWERIALIEPQGECDVYDATVPEVHNFVANEFVVHNSIEQDSDIVLFMLRREYYDPNDKPGSAELIIAKNRHGGVGSVQLNFHKELAKFSNYMHQSAPDEEDSFAKL